jgi:hypothetical protein
MAEMTEDRGMMTRRTKTIITVFIAFILGFILATCVYSAQMTLSLTNATGGTSGCLDAIYAAGDGTHYNPLATGTSAIVYDADEDAYAIYRFYIAGSPQTPNGKKIIKPLWLSYGVAYTGNGAWHRKGLIGKDSGADYDNLSGTADDNTYDDLISLIDVALESAGGATDIHGATEKTSVSDLDELLVYSVAHSANRKMTRENFVFGLGGSFVDNSAYGSDWLNRTDKAPSSHQVYQKIQSLVLGAGTGDVSGPASSEIDGLVVFDDTTGKTIKAYTGSGIPVLASGVVSTITDNHANWDAGYTYRVTGASGTSPLTLNLAGNAITGSIQAASSTQSGYLTQSDWNTFNSKQAALTTGNVTATTPLGVSATRQVIGGTLNLTITDAAADGATKGAASFGASDFNSTSGNITIDYTNAQAASSTTKGFLTAADWTSFNSKQAGDPDLTALAGISGQRGDMIRYGASGWERIPKGTLNQILVMGSNDPAWGNNSAGQAYGAAGVIQISDGVTGFSGDSDYYYDTSTDTLYVGTGGIVVAQSATLAGGWSGKELSGNGTNFLGFKVPDAITSDRTYLLIDTAPSAGQVMAWSAPSGGVSTQSWVTPAVIDDSKGDGDTGYAWSADKVYDELALKVTSGGALGTPSSGTLTNCTFPTLNQNTTGTASGITGKTTPTGNIVGTTDTQTLTNKTLSTGSIIPAVIGLACSDETTPLTTGTGKVTFRMPHAMTLTEVRASVGTAPVGSTIIVDINEGGSTIMTTNKLSIDASEKTSTTADTAAGITDSALADDAEITIDIDQVGSSTPGSGLKIWLIGTRTL